MTDGARSAPLVSVVIPTVIVDDYLQQAVESVLEQRACHLEVIVVMDGADTPYPVPEYLMDDRVILVEHKFRRGTPVALNSGIAVARGQFIARLDADDLALQGRFTAQVDFLCRNPSVACVGTGAVLIDSQGNDIGKPPTAVMGTIVTSALLARNPLLHSSVMYRAEQVRAIGGYSDVMRRMQDYELYLRIALIGEVATIPEAYAAYRIHSDQFSRNTSPWAQYTRLILRRRLELANHLGAPRILQLGRNAVWFLAQVSRHYGLTRPRYMRRR